MASVRCVRNPDMSGIWSTVGRHAEVGRPRGPYRLKRHEVLTPPGTRSAATSDELEEANPLLAAIMEHVEA